MIILLIISAVFLLGYAALVKIKFNRDVTLPANTIEGCIKYDK